MELFKAIFCVILAGACLAGMDASAKYQMQKFPMIEVVWFRYFIHMLAIWLALKLFTPSVPWHCNKPRLQIVRGIFMLLVTVFFYLAIRSMDLSDAAAILFFAPVLVTILAGLILGEKITRYHIISVLIGFCGVLFIIQPTYKIFDLSMFFSLCSALALALYYVLTRKLKGKDSEITILFHSALPGMVLMSVIAVFEMDWLLPQGIDWLFMFAMGILGLLGHYFLVKGFHYATASTLAPFLNAQLVAATLYSVLFFNDHLEWNFYLGALLIVIAGLVVWVFDRAKSRPENLL